jgi:hypothetical protein
MRHIASAVCILALMLLPLTACGGTPPQIVDYEPQRGALTVSTAAAIKITFDHAVDQESVVSRLRLVPATDGTVRWTSPRHLVFEHPTLQASTTYEVILEPGYRDLAGNTYSLRHHWAFVTERPPSLTGSAPADNDTGVDPAAYLSLDFTREMNPASVRSALTFSPGVSFNVQTDGRRAIVGPSQLLQPNTAYQITINSSALDVNGSPLSHDQAIRFTTGATRPLRHWLTFATGVSSGASGGLWIVNEIGFPRELFHDSAVHAFSWSPAGDTLLIQGDNETWLEFVPGGGTVQLGFQGTWAGALGSGLGYVYLDDAGTLHRWSGADEVISTDVAQAAVAPNGLRVAFVHGSVASNEVWGYDVGLRARYQLAVDTGPVNSVSWAPSGNRVAYLRNENAVSSLRVRNLTGAGTTTTAATGDLGVPSWLPDSTHIVFAAGIQGAGGLTHKAFVVNVVAPPAVLNPAAGLPSDPSIDVAAPVPSPDGHQIAFLNLNQTENQVWLMNADGTRPAALTRFAAESFPYSCRALAWTKA